MKTIHFSFSLLLFCSIFLAGCRTGKDGAPGPAGTTGASGTSGVSGEDALNKQGTITGTLYYNYENSYSNETDTLMLPFTYEYYETETENAFKAYTDPSTQQTIHQYDLRRRELKDNASYFYVGYNYGTIPSGPVPSDFNFDFSLSRIMSASSIYAFRFSSNFNGNDNSVLTVTNYAFNAVTGDLSFDYDVDIDPRAVSSGLNTNTTVRAHLKGSVNVTMKRSLGSFNVNR